MTACDRCGDSVQNGKRGAYGWSLLCLDCYANLTDWEDIEFGA